MSLCTCIFFFFLLVVMISNSFFFFFFWLVEVESRRFRCRRQCCSAFLPFVGIAVFSGETRSSGEELGRIVNHVDSFFFCQRLCYVEKKEGKKKASEPISTLLAFSFFFAALFIPGGWTELSLFFFSFSLLWGGASNGSPGPGVARRVSWGQEREEKGITKIREGKQRESIYIRKGMYWWWRRCTGGVAPPPFLRLGVSTMSANFIGDLPIFFLF